MYTCTNHQTCTINTTSLNGLNNILPNSSDQRNGPKCYKCRDQGHMRHECKTERVYCTNCRSPNHDIRACRKYQNSNHSQTNSNTPTGYNPTATPPPLLGTATTETTTTTDQGPWFQNGASPARSANMTEALTQILTQVANNKKRRGQQMDDEEHL